MEHREFIKIDESGNVKFSLEKRGRGPGEYLSITYFDIDAESGDILVFDQVGWTILRYSSNGDFLWSRKIKHGCDESILLSENRFLNYMPHWIDSPDRKRGLWVEDIHGTEQTQIFRIDDNHRFALTDPYLLSFRRFDKGTIGVYDSSRDIIVHVYPDGSAFDRYKISFDKTIPSSILKGHEPVDPYNDNRIYTVVQYYETNHWMLVSAICAQQRIDLFYDKTHDVAHIVKKYGDILLDVPGIVPRDWWWSSENRLIAPFYPDRNSEISLQTFPSMDESNNPVLVVAHVN
jgi:hypothetical protein